MPRRAAFSGLFLVLSLYVFLNAREKCGLALAYEKAIMAAFLKGPEVVGRSML
jgi:hypothetical protein